MPSVTITLEDTPTGGVSIHTAFKPAIGQRCSPAQSAALDLISRANKDWNAVRSAIAVQHPELAVRIEVKPA